MYVIISVDMIFVMYSLNSISFCRLNRFYICCIGMNVLISSVYMGSCVE